MTTSWYRDGTISVANGSTAVTGVGTLWASSGTIEEGDLFTIDGTKMYEIASVTDDTHLTLRTPFTGTSVVDGTYSIIINFSVQPAANMIGKQMLLINKWMIREQELYEWQTAPASGTSSPTMVTLHSWNGDATSYKSLPQIIEDINNVDWSDISGIPATFTPAPHTQDWSTITGVPATFTPSAHVHSGADITSGTIPVARLGASGTRSAANLLLGDNTWGSTLAGNFALSAATTETRSFEIGTGRTGDGNSFIDLIGDATYTDYGLRLLRSPGPNGGSTLVSRGTGTFIIQTTEMGTISLRVGAVARLNIDGTTNIVSFPVNGALGGIAHGTTINGAAGTARRIRMASDGSARWELGSDGTAEGGTNAGSDFVLNRYDDAGASLGTVFFITRSTGRATFNQGLTVGGNTLQVNNAIVATGNVTGSNQITSKAGASSNAHFYLRDDTDTNQGLFYWDRTTDKLFIRRYDTAGTGTEGQLEIGPTNLLWNNQLVLTANNTGGGNYGIMANRGAIAAGTDLNSQVETGIWHQNSNANATLALNYPVAGQAGMLEVFAATDTNFVYQTYTLYQNGAKYRRTKYSTTWGAWIENIEATANVIGGNRTFSGSVGFGTRIFGDFNNATRSLRTFLQAGAAGGTSVGLLPGTGGTAAFIEAYNGTDPVNAGTASFGVIGNTGYIQMSKTGTGTTPTSVSFRWDTVEKFSIDNAGWIRADFSSAAGSRAQVQTSTANSPTNLTVVPSGTGVQSLFSAFNASNAASAAAIQIGADASQAYVNTARTGSATGIPLNFNIEGTTVMQLAAAGTSVSLINNSVLRFNNAIRQHITLWETSTTPGNESSYGIGVQNSSWYARSDAGFAFFQKGTHTANKFDPGSNGKMLVQFDADSNGNACVGIGGAHGSTSTAVIVHRGALGTQQGHYALAQGGNRIWQIGMDTDRSFRLWSYTDAGAFQQTGLSIDRTAQIGISSAGIFAHLGWFRSQQYGTGWYHELGGGGWYMTDTTWIRNYNNKPLMLQCTGGTVARFESPSPTFEWYDTDEGHSSWIHFNSGNHGFLAHSSFAWACYRDSSNRWVCNGDIIAFASDKRLKTNVFDVAMSEVDRILMGTRVRIYDWDAAALAKYKIQGVQAKTDQIGAIAQEVQAVFPDAVQVNGAHNQIGEDPIDILTIQWEKYVPLLIAKIQDLERRLAAVEV